MARARLAVVVLCAALAPASAAAGECQNQCTQGMITCNTPTARSGQMTHGNTSLADHCNRQYGACLARCPPDRPQVQTPTPGMPGAPNPFQPKPLTLPDFGSNNLGPLPPPVEAFDEGLAEHLRAEADRKRWQWQLEQNNRLLAEGQEFARKRDEALYALCKASPLPTGCKKPGPPAPLPTINLAPKPWQPKRRGAASGGAGFSVEGPPVPPIVEVKEHAEATVRACGPMTVHLELDANSLSDREVVRFGFSNAQDHWNAFRCELELFSGDGRRWRDTVVGTRQTKGGPFFTRSFAPFDAAVGQPNVPITGYRVSGCAFRDVSTTLDEWNRPGAHGNMPNGFGVPGTTYIGLYNAPPPMEPCPGGGVDTGVTTFRRSPVP